MKQHESWEPVVHRVSRRGGEWSSDQREIDTTQPLSIPPIVIATSRDALGHEQARSVRRLHAILAAELGVLLSVVIMLLW